VASGNLVCCTARWKTKEGQAFISRMFVHMYIYYRRHAYTTESSEAVKLQKVKEKSGDMYKTGSVCKT